jgi:hypothetical protein
MSVERKSNRKFFIYIIKPSHYDDQGYVIQWRRAFVPSNTLGCVLALVEDVKARNVLGEDVDLVVNAYDEINTVIPTKKIIYQIKNGGGNGLVMMIGVQSNQFPRTSDLTREFRSAGIQVAIGGFHVSGCIAMLPKLPTDIQALLEDGVTLFAGEAEGRMEIFLRDALHGELKPIYNYLSELPGLQGAVTPFLPRELAKRYMTYTAFDAGRGCPFKCSFCTIINVQGNKSRWRDADDVEKIVRTNWAQDVKRFFISDDNFARNKNWEPIFDRLIELRENEGIRVRFLMQVDTMCHKIPGFVEKARAAGCNRVLIGLENINPSNLQSIQKKQNMITEYRAMLQVFRKQGIITYACYILGFPADTQKSIEQDISIIQKELPVDILEFFILTPLPGSVDHRSMYNQDVWMDPDFNKYDLEHVTTRNHPKMSPDELQAIYNRVWHLYYSPEHIETLLRRAETGNIRTKSLAMMIWLFYGSYCCEGVHPLQAGIFRRKVRTSRRKGFPIVSPVLFYPRLLWEIVTTHYRILQMYCRVARICKKVRKDPANKEYTDLALSPIDDGAAKDLDMFQHTDDAKLAYKKANT